jgi:hypothetical protein
MAKDFKWEEWDSFVDLKVELLGIMLSMGLNELSSEHLIGYYDQCTELDIFYSELEKKGTLPEGTAERCTKVRDWKCRIKQTLTLRPEYWNYFTDGGDRIVQTV